MLSPWPPKPPAYPTHGAYVEPGSGRVCKPQPAAPVSLRGGATAVVVVVVVAAGGAVTGAPSFSSMEATAAAAAMPPAKVVLAEVPGL